MQWRKNLSSDYSVSHLNVWIFKHSAGLSVVKIDWGCNARFESCFKTGVFNSHLPKWTLRLTLFPRARKKLIHRNGSLFKLASGAQFWEAQKWIKHFNYLIRVKITKRYYLCPWNTNIWHWEMPLDISNAAAWRGAFTNIQLIPCRHSECLDECRFMHENNVMPNGITSNSTSVSNRAGSVLSGTF